MDSSLSDDIRKSVRNGLSLECDAKFLQYMEIISKKLINRAKTTNNNIDSMCSELHRTSISLENVTNRLSTLSHTKFVENRVYEDDETIANIKEVPVEIKTKEYNPIKTLNTVIKNNMKMLDNCYEKVSVELDDSDEEDEQIKSIVYRPKNKFETLPIPHLIGSKEWKEKWHVGIHDSDESFSENDNEEFSDGSDSLSLPSNGPTISESGSSVWSINRNSKFNIPPNKRNDYTSSDDEEISTTSKTSSNEAKQRNIRILPTQIPAVYEQRYYVHQPREKGLFDESSESENEIRKIPGTQNKNFKEITPELLPRHQPIGSNQISNIFSDEPPDLDAVEQKNKRPSKLFFDSDEGELFNQNEKENSAQILPPKLDNVRKKTVNLFDDNDFNSFMKELDKKTNEKLPKAADRNIKLFEDENKNIPQIDSKNTNLFDDKYEERVIKTTEKTPEVVNKQNKLFDDQISSHKNIIEKISTSKKLEATLRTSLFEDEDDLFSTTIKPIIEKSTATKIANLFDDTPPDDEFDNLFKTSNRVLENSSNSASSSVPKSSTKLIKNLFDDDIEDEKEDIFKNPTNFVENSPNTLKIIDKNKQIFAELPIKSQNINKKNIQQSLKNEENSINFISSKKNIFTEDEDTDNEKSNIFTNNIKDSNENKITEILPAKFENIFNNKSISSSLFDDVPEDDDDFFQSLVNNKQNNKTGESENIIENDEEIIVSKSKTAQHNNDIQFNSVDDIKILHDQPPISKSTNEKLSNLSTDEPPPDDEENLFADKSSDAVSNEKSNNDVSIENSEENTEILDKNYDEKNNSGLTKVLVNEILENNPVPHTEWNSSSNLETIGDNVNFVKRVETEKIENKTNINDETAKLNNKPSVNSVFIPTIFDETPPDDNGDIFVSPTKANSHETEIFEAPLDNFKKTQKIPSISNYDSILFQDNIPPDDNNDEKISIFSDNKLPKSIKTSIKSILVDDIFSEKSSTTINQKTPINVNFIFDDEPPTDAFNYVDENKALGKIVSKQSELIEEKSLSVSDLIKKVSTSNKLPDSGKSKLSLGPKKLSTNFNINVAALIPGAKRPIVSPVHKDESDGSISTKRQSSNFEEESKLAMENKQSDSVVKQTTEEQKHILISLNKNRVTIPKKRRPSTKHGRLENYRKSLADNGNEENTQDFDNLNENTDDFSNKNIQIEKLEKAIQKTDSIFSDENDNNNIWPTKSINNENNSSKSEYNLQPKIESISSNQNKELLNKSKNQFNSIEESKRQSILFSYTDNNDDDDDLLFKATSKTDSTQQKNLYSEAKLEKSGTQSQENTLNNNPNNDIITIPKSKSLLTNQNDKTHDDWLFKSSTEKNILSSGVTKLETKKNRDPLFFDDDDKNDLFSENLVKTLPKNEVHQKNTKPTENLPSKDENENGIFKKIKIYKKKPIHKQEPINNIDGKIQKSVKSIDKLKTKSIGLFDSDDDDDLFGSNSTNKKLSINKNIPSIENNKKILNVPKRDNLFDDIDDDDDDLFGTKTTKAQKHIIEKPKVNQSQGESTGYNPLADLLNEK